MLPVVWSQPNLLGFVEIDDIGISSKFCLNSDWHDDRVPYAWEQPNSFVCLLLQSFFWQCYIQNHLTMNLSQTFNIYIQTVNIYIQTVNI